MLKTTYVTASGTAIVLDTLATGAGNRGHALGRDAPHLLLREVTCTEGHVELHVEYVPRPEYGLVAPLFDPVDGGLLATGGGDTLILSRPIPMTVESSCASARLSLCQGDSVGLALSPQTRRMRGRPGSGRRSRSRPGWPRPGRWIGTRSGRRSCATAGASGWSAFTQSLGSDDLDASNLVLSIIGFLPADDPRVLATIEATEERLTGARGLVYRYRAPDGLEGREGSFLLVLF